MENNRNSLGSLIQFWGLIFIVVLVLPVISSGVKILAESQFGIEIPRSGGVFAGSLSNGVACVGLGIIIFTMLFSQEKEEDNGKKLKFFLIPVIAIELVRSCDLVFLQILPQVQWAKTNDLLVFLALLALLSSYILVGVFYPKILNSFEGDAEDEENETDTEDEEKEKVNEEKENN